MKISHRLKGVLAARPNITGTALCLILLALLGFTSQAQADVEQFVIPVGEVGSSPPDPNPWVIAPSYPDTTTCVLVWEDNKQLEFGPGVLSFFIDGDSGSPYTGAALPLGSVKRQRFL
jgi:hypothetical protein